MKFVENKVVFLINVVVGEGAVDAKAAFCCLGVELLYSLLTICLVALFGGLFCTRLSSHFSAILFSFCFAQGTACLVF